MLRRASPVLHLVFLVSACHRPGVTVADMTMDRSAAPDEAASDRAADHAAFDVSTARTDGGTEICSTSNSSDLPGVSIRFTATTCTFTLAQAAAGITIPYQVEIVTVTPDVASRPQDDGLCDRPDQSGLALFERLSGMNQKYCLCDHGFCLPMQWLLPPRTLAVGVYPESFSWDGRNWTGPSDTDRPKGPPFPPGTYTLDVSAVGMVGSAPFTVDAKLSIVLTP